MNSVLYSIILIAITAVVTFSLRAFPFMVFGGKRQMPNNVRRVVSLLPPGIMGVLLIYCVKSDIVSVGMNTIASIASIAVVVMLHIFKRNTLLSIAVGTVLYMVLIRVL